MDIALVVVTLASLGFALVLLTLNWRLIREERRRSAARVEALLEAVSTLPAQVPMPIHVPLPVASASPRHEPKPRVSAAPAAIEARADTALLNVVSNTATESPVISSHELFHEAVAPASGFRRLAVPVSLGVVIVGLILAGLLTWSPGPPKPAVSPGVPVAARTTIPVPLELMSLRHERTGNGLSITGLVRNPASGGRVADVNVVVFLFDRNGAFVTSTKGPLDFRTLAPGDESPFTVSLEKIGTIGRYRVSFRAEDKVVPHVDRRQDPVVAVASTQPR
jgi:hypothetical protein